MLLYYSSIVHQLILLLKHPQYAQNYSELSDWNEEDLEEPDSMTMSRHGECDALCISEADGDTMHAACRA